MCFPFALLCRFISFSLTIFVIYEGYGFRFVENHFGHSNNYITGSGKVEHGGLVMHATGSSNIVAIQIIMIVILSIINELSLIFQLTVMSNISNMSTFKKKYRGSIKEVQAIWKNHHPVASSSDCNCETGCSRRNLQHSSLPPVLPYPPPRTPTPPRVMSVTWRRS